MEVDPKWRADGGPAFPAESRSHYWRGMSARDYFAAKCLEGYAKADWQGLTTYSEDFAAKAYQVADAMLAQREK